MQLRPSELTAALHRLKRARGQLDGVIRMIESGSECEATVNQLAAVSRALDKAGFAIISQSLWRCLNEGEASGMDTAKLEKLMLSLA